MKKFTLNQIVNAFFSRSHFSFTYHVCEGGGWSVILIAMTIFSTMPQLGQNSTSSIKFKQHCIKCSTFKFIKIPVHQYNIKVRLQRFLESYCSAVPFLHARLSCLGLSKICEMLLFVNQLQTHTCIQEGGGLYGI